MPHKHTRKGQIDKSTVDLPPTTLALPLSVSKSATSNGIFTSELSTSKPNKTKPNNKKRKRKDTDDDTPKAFQRLMAFAKRRRVEAEAQAKFKTKTTHNPDADANDDIEIQLSKPTTKDPAKQENNTPTIRPSERLSDFSTRIDAALLIAGLINKSVRNGKDPLGLKVGRTKTEKRMHRMYDEWRAEEARIQERRMEARELAEDDEMDSDGEGQVRWKVPPGDAGAGGVGGAGGKNKKNKGKGKGRKKVLGEVDDREDNLWAHIGKNRGEVKAGLNDVVLAPPTFTKPPKEKFKVRGAMVDVGDVPSKSGSLRRREKLGGVRREVVRGYREMMKGKGAGIGKGIDKEDEGEEE
ncbi:hypothetical protein DL98DRAFT_662204 [Cadophora sp. DSE1049]|nr:hypothetical protein DL98DRAFT_662204 [Cadophora sp. DSE1049]